MTNQRDAAVDPGIRPSPWSLSIHQVGLTVILCGIFVASLAPYLNTDLWWHLRAGEMIVSSGAVSEVDTLSFTAYGEPWLNHEWLAEVVFYQVHDWFGILGLLLLVASLVAATFLLVHLRMRRRGSSPLIALVVLIPAFIASINSVYLRIQPVTLLLLALFLLLLDDFRLTGRRLLLLPLPPLMLLWANLHGGFAVGLAVIFIALAGSALDLQRGNSSLRRGDLAALLICLLVSALASLATPGGLDTFMYPFRFITPNFFTENINESQRPAFADPITIAFEILLLGLIASALIRRKTASWADVLLIVAVTHLGLSQLRHMSVFAVATAPLLAGYATETLAGWRKDAKTAGQPPVGRMRTALHAVILLAALLILAAIATSYLSPVTIRSVERKDYPAAACDFLRNGEAGTKVLADYRWGGYVLWNLGPPFRTFIDGRADTVFDDATFRTYLKIFGLQPGWESALGRSGADVVLLEPDSRLAAALSKSGDWTELYRDGIAVVFGRADVKSTERSSL